MSDPEGIKALVAKWRAEAGQHDMNALEADSVGLVDAAECGRLMALVKIQLADELESLTAVAEESRAITALKVTLFETECYLPASIAKRVQAACTVGVAGDAEGVAWELLAEEVAAMPRTYEACDYQDEYKAAALRAIRRALNTRQAFETMPAPAPGCDTRHAVTFYFNDKAAAEQFRTRQAVEGMVQVATVDGVDEYGPRLSWSLHWTELVGQPLFAAAAPQAGKGDK